MPAVEKKPMWGDLEGDDDEDSGLPPTETKGPNKDGIKTVIEYRWNDDFHPPKKEKVTKTYRVEVQKRKLNKAEQERAGWARFGDAKGAPKGPQSDTTSVSDDVYLTLTSSSKDLDKPEEDDPLKKMTSSKIVSCRICQGAHFSARCPYKDTISMPEEPEPEPEPERRTGAYVPPSMRGGASASASAGSRMGGRDDDTTTVRVTNLSEDTRESDLQELFRPFGMITRIFLAKDKITGLSKGFAFINYVRKDDAQNAIDKLCGYGYDHLILNVEWARPAVSAD
ncbi:hypothetical protein SARC_11385 [Sphaeroforma arctica JP610]|uniref:Eukaryotic translation initiation factor 3 subunit G n=1 Tax=Sphaeroforma arctica JP610 TaxID=667725 RepID=A0A0L0FH56_9EUKA|nr:hypothetical protein SARC_11385 [Sphaeroforma arctica JP610]KNC76104.1 hypothetical protein SARC_11385 [Sphaeroforma arctica JP610]|eukprot:XP_014150006.1 hypothetical protein SARC_11385 [Sphaeroforma arctica JP610]